MGKLNREVTPAMREAQKRYRKTAKGREAARRARDKYRGFDAEQCRARAQWREEERREIRRDRIRRGLPPDLPASAPRVHVAGGKGFRASVAFEEVSTPERRNPEYIAAALALEDLI